MRPKNICTSSKISNRPRHPQNAVHRPRRQLQQIDRILQHRLIVRFKPADRIRLRLIKMRIAAPRTMSLNFARTNHTCTHHVAGFTGWRIGSQFGWWQSRDFDMQVDAFK
jgi:hypothetical protein